MTGMPSGTIISRCPAAVCALVLVLAGCTGSDGGDGDGGGGSDRADDTASSAAPSTVNPSPETSSAPATGSAPASSSAPATAAVPPAASQVSIPGLIERDYDGRRLRLGQVLARTGDYVRHAATYRSDGLRISGVMNIPTGKGPFPVLVLLHGYIDPAYYVTGQGLMREQDYLARAGYAVLHIDYRNHAGSDDDPTAERRLRLGYTADTINAVLAVKRSGIARLDGDRVGLLGRSMGGGVTYNALVTRPGLVKAAVVFAPVSSRTADNFNRWIRDDRSELAGQITRRHGTPQGNPRFWREVSPRPYFDRVTEPVLIHHGTSDDSCPIRWTRASYAALQEAGAEARLFVYDGEEHAFGPQWPLSMRRTVSFLDRAMAA
jgi:dipeptidyl aminopeptidase/acylaminoacyl peptidase